MKTLTALLFAIAMGISILLGGSLIALAETSAFSPAQETIVRKTKNATKKTYHKGHYVTRRIWVNGRYVTKRVWVKGKWTGGKIVKGTRWTTHKTKRGTKKVYNTIVH